MNRRNRIVGFRVRNFKSHEDTSVELGDLNVFIGENGAGKSNLLDALLIVSDLQFENVGKVFSPPRRAYFEDCMRRGANDGMMFETVFHVMSGSYRYVVSLDSKSSAQNPKVVKETLFGAETGEEFLTLQNGKGRARDMSARAMVAVDYSDVSVALARLQDRVRYPWAVESYEFLSTVRRFHFDPNVMRQPSKVDPSAVLGEKGENIAAVFDRMERETQDAVTSIMKSALPGIARIESRAAHGGSKIIAVKEAWNPIPFHADQVSDGIFRYLGLSLLAHDGSDAGVCLIEEPENGLNPHRYASIVDLYRSAASGEGPQLLAATHSIGFVDYLERGELFSISNRDGRSDVRRVSDISGFAEKWRAFDAPLGEAWFAGLLEEGKK